MGAAVGLIAMKFESFAAFIQMDGHGLYIWLAYGITLIVLAVNLWWPSRARKQFVRQEQRVRTRTANAQEKTEDAV